MCITLEELGISGSNAPPHSGKVKILHPLDMDDSQMPIGYWGEGVWKLWSWSVHKQPAVTAGTFHRQCYWK